MKRLAGLLIVALAACRSFAPGTDAKSLGAPGSEGEDRLWSQAARLEEALDKSGQVIDDASAQAYVEKVVRRLYPEFGDRLHPELLRAPVLNAFALPDGHIYVNLGLIEMLDNEAQLATVLGHEAIHVINRHAAQQRQSRIAGVGIATAISLGVPLLPQLAVASALAGFSREQETEADREGFKRLVAAGYDPRESTPVFEHFLGEVKATEEKQPFFFADHPSLEARVQNFQALLRETPAASGDIGQERFDAALGGLRRQAVLDKLAAGRYASVIYSLTSNPRPPLGDPEAAYTLGEAYRLRGKGDDPARALAAYQRAAADPAFAPAHRGLGLLKLKSGDRAEARAEFQQYLQLAPQAPDRGYIESYLQQL